jgi:hypothetical protein
MNARSESNANGFPLAVATFIALTLTACEAGDEQPIDEDQTLEIISNLEQAGYPEQEISVDELGQVIVGGDAVVTLEASREMIGLTRTGESAEGGDDVFRQYRTTNVIDSAIDNICINGSALSANTTLSAALDGAIANYNNQNLTFNLTRISGPPGSGCDAVINAVLTSGSGGLAWFPAGGLPYETVNIGSGVAAYGAGVAKHVITHEIGHCIGFRHTDYYNRAISCGWDPDPNEGQGGVGAHHIPNTPYTAVYNGSIMNSCFNPGSTGVWTAEDLDALHQLYGRDCCEVGSGAGCGNVLVSECVGALDSYCNDTQWDSICVDEVTAFGCGTCPITVEHGCCSTGGAGCSDNVIEAAICADEGYDGTGEVDPYCCEVAWDGLCVAGVNNLPDEVVLPCGSDCCAPKGTPGCGSASVEACVAAVDPWCVNVAWDALCVAEVESLGCSRCP